MSSFAAITTTSAQRDIWYAQNLSPAVPFTIAHYVDLVGEVDLQVLAHCADRAHREFGSTTVRFVDNDGAPEQRRAAGRLSVSVVDLRSEADPEAEAHRWMGDDCLTPCALDSPCLVTAAILRITDHRCFWYTRAHHIVLDGYGSMMVLRRTAELFLAATTGTTPDPVDPMSPVDTLTADAKYTASTRYERDKHYWANIMNEVESQTSLAGRSAPPAAHCHRVSGTIPNSAVPESDRWIERGTKTSTVMVAAFAAFHARMTDTPDTTLALPLAGRPTARLRQSGGTHSTVVPLPLPGIGTTTVDGAVKLTEVAVTGALRHQLFQSAYGSDDVHDRGPVVNLMLFDDRVPLGPVDGTLHILTTGPVADIALDIHQGRSDEQWGWEFEANPALYSPDDLDLLAQRFVHFLHQFLRPDDHDTNIAELELELPDRASPPVQSGRPATETSTLPGLLVRRCSDRAHCPAVRYNGSEISYSELDRESNSLAGALAAHGIRTGDTVAVMVPRSIDSVVAFWAVARSGATYLPIDSNFPPARIEYILADSAAKLALCIDSTHTSAGAVTTLRVDDAGNRRHGDALTAQIAPNDSAYVIYTSGTTGAPKGVSVTHAGLGPLVAHMDDVYRLSTESRILHCASTSFDTSLVEMLAAATAGCTLVVPPTEIAGGRELTSTMAHEGVTHLFATPSVLATLAPASLADLAVVISGGEPCPQQLADAVSEHVALFNAYGPTETTCSVTMTGALTPGESVTIGTPMRGVDTMVLDRSLRPRPVGTLGELYISAAAVARGYVGRPKETASRFVAAPFGRPGHRMYRTGDVVRRRVDGTLDYVGRGDAQVKLRGIRIEPAEVDAALCTFGPVQQSITTIVEPREGHSVLVSYVVAAPHTSIDPVAVRTFVAALLPAYMVPATVTVLDCVPLTPNGKVDMRALPSPTTAFEMSSVHAAPRGQTEVALAEIFTAVLALDSIDANISFFDLGGNSLAATRVVGQINACLHVSVAVRDLVAHPTIRSLAATLEYADAAITRPVPGSSDGVAVIPLAPPQAHLDRTTDVALYNLPFTIEVSAPVNVGALELALRDVIERHRTLRTVYADSQWGPRQIVRPMDVADIPVVEYADMDSLLAMLHRGFDVSSDLPIRIGYTRGATTHIVGCTIHHIAADGWSLGVLARDILGAYLARVDGAAPAWTELPLHYADYAVWANAATYDSDVEYWRRELAGCPSELPLPFDRERPSVASLRAGRRQAYIEDYAVQKLTDVGARVGAGLFTAVRAALVITLARLTSSTDIVIGTPTAGRTDPMLDDLVGMFVNTLAMRTDISGAEYMTDVVRLCHDTEVRALDHSGVQFEELVGVLEPARPSWAHPFFQVALSYDTFVPMHLDTADLIAAIVPRPVDVARCDIHVHVAAVHVAAVHVAAEPSSAGISALNIDVVYSHDVFEDSTVAAFTDSFLGVVSELCTDPSARWAISPNNQER
ncbi:amino acid adenylation domain-containing protein [Rhodococcus sp. G-MC3]|uniref:amino acid adenylation domain-containing protein n=1 Tax=Rhodococcus sp. G-MC3 TaxID=3046209 RepID=UPI0024BADB0B|nr:amino acid adenylation domain-containing protein [Rhodococcus sp. G-MC3]MDJ0392920.1 amino acid adenylation domain-containing protein [Rhodococcus sp. G-MC3]